MSRSLFFCLLYVLCLNWWLATAECRGEDAQFVQVQPSGYPPIVKAKLTRKIRLCSVPHNLVSTHAMMCGEQTWVCVADSKGRRLASHAFLGWLTEYVLPEALPAGKYKVEVARVPISPPYYGTTTEMPITLIVSDCKKLRDDYITNMINRVRGKDDDNVLNSVLFSVPMPEIFNVCLNKLCSPDLELATRSAGILQFAKPAWPPDACSLVTRAMNRELVLNSNNCDHMYLRDQLARVAVRIGSDQTVDCVLAYLRQMGDSEPQFVFPALSESNHPRVLDALRRRLKSKSAEVRRYAAEALAYNREMRRLTGK